MNIIKKARKEKGLTRREVADIIRISLPKYILYEHDFGRVELFDAIALSQLLRFDI